MARRSNNSRHTARRPAPPKRRVRISLRGNDDNNSGEGPPLFPENFKGKLIHFILLCIIWGGILVTGYIAYCALTLPNLNEAEALKRKPSIVVLAADGSTIAEFGERSAAPLKLSELPPAIPNAVMAVEDRRFYSHMGIDPLGLLRAAFVNLISGHTVQGGSTLTQQLAKNLFLTPERHFKRKVQEMLIALWLEHKYSKTEILEAYLNRVYFGAGAYGVEAASQTYFGKSARNDNVREAATLAGLLKAPSKYSPKSDPDESAARTAVVLNAMADAGYISDAEAKAQIRAVPAGHQRLALSGEGRYFADWVVSQAQEIVGDVEGDLVIKTTLDRSMQRAAEAAIKRQLDKDGAESRAGQAAAVLMGGDGATLALVGGRDYSDSQFNRAIQAQRQPGSAFKPFVYLTALEKGISPDTVMDSAPRSYKFGRTVWTPNNYEGEHPGSVTLRTALAESLNTVAVALLDQIGVAPVKKTAARLGITSPLPNDLSLALGSGVVSPYELTTAYAAIAAGGRAIAPYSITEIRLAAPDGKGEVLYKHTDVVLPQVEPAASVATLTTMMEGVVTGGTGRAAALDRPVAGKTGTSSDYRDAWFAGFTRNHTLAVWVGNDDNSPMRKVTGGGLPTRIWHEIMAAAEAGVPPQALLDDAALNIQPAEPADDSHDGGWFDTTPSAPATPATTPEDPDKSDDSGLGGVFGRLLHGT